MYALLALLGIGLLFSVFNDSDDGESSDREEEPETFTDDDDVVIGDLFRDAIEANAADLVAEGELTQAQADAALGDVNFRGGSLNIDTGAGDDYVAGSNGADTIVTGSGDDFVIGARGDDFINLGEGADVYGVEQRAIETQDDTVGFPDGDFEILGSEAQLEGGDDTILAGPGNDAISDGFGSNEIFGQQGADFIVAVDQEANRTTPDMVDGGFGNDTIFFDEGDTVTGNQGRDDFTLDVFRGVGTGYQASTITDFDPARDQIEVQGTADLLQPGGVSQVTVADLADGSGAVISINGIAVAQVVGGAGLTIGDVRLTIG